MPIQNGRYISPTWVNGGPPALEQTELQAITDTLEALDAGTSGGGSGKRYASLVIGTSTNGWTTEDCDYLCDGIADQVEIEEAVGALPSGGGCILFLDGVYNFSGDLIIHPAQAEFRITIRGCGKESVLNFSGNRLGYYNYGDSNYTTIDFSEIAIQSAESSVTGSGTISFEECLIRNANIQGSAYASVIVNSCHIIADSSSATQMFISAGGTTLISKTYLCFTGNLVEIKNDQSLSMLSSDGNGSISGNVFVYSASSEVTALVSRGDSCVTGNTLINCSLTASGNSSVSGNVLLNGGITAYEKVSVCGNTIEDGNIFCAEAATISGNNISQPTDQSDVYCIILSRWRNNEEENTPSTISGNTCIGGNVGIILQTPGTMPTKTKTNACITGNTCTAEIPLQINSNWSDCLITGNMFPNGAIVDNGTGNIKANNFTAS